MSYLHQLDVQKKPICKLSVALTWLAWQLILFGISTHESSRPSVNYAPTSPKPLHRPLTLRASCWKKFNFISKHPLSHVVDAHRVSCFLHASIHSSKAGVEEEAKIFFISFWILPSCERENPRQLLPYFPSPKGSSCTSSSVKCHMDFHRFTLFGFFV